MACSSLVALPRACGSDGNVGGLEKLYVISFSDLSGTTVYEQTSGGTISAIHVNSGKTFVEIGLLKSTSGLNESMTKNAQAGTSFLTQSMTLVLGKLTNENRAFVASVLNQPIAALFKTRTGKWFVAGLNGQFELSALDGGTGVAESDLAGYTLTFNGISTQLIPEVDAAIVPTIIA